MANFSRLENIIINKLLWELTDRYVQLDRSATDVEHIVWYMDKVIYNYWGGTSDVSGIFADTTLIIEEELNARSVQNSTRLPTDELPWHIIREISEIIVTLLGDILLG